jgi:hypothetical protein
MPTPRQIATAEAGGEPLTSFHKMTLLIMPVLRPKSKHCLVCSTGLFNKM